MPCDTEMLKGVELFEHLSDEDCLSLARVIDLRKLASGAPSGS